MSSPPPTASDVDVDSDASKPAPIRITIPERFYLLPGAAIVLGTTIGLFRGSRRASLRFLAENVHRPPTTVQGWYFYNKTKNYRVIMGGLKEAGLEAARLGTTAAGWVCFEEGAKRLGAEGEAVKEIVAGVGTAGVFSLAYRLPRKAAGRTLVLGLLLGCSLRGLRWTQEKLRSQASERARQLEATAVESRVEVVETISEAVEAVEAATRPKA